MYRPQWKDDPTVIMFDSSDVPAVTFMSGFLPPILPFSGEVLGALIPLLYHGRRAEQREARGPVP